MGDSENRVAPMNCLMIGIVTRLLTLGIASTLLACTQRAYQGPALPASEVAVVQLTSTSGLNLSGLIIQGHETSVFSSSIEVLPGTLEIRFSYRRESIRCDTLQEWCDILTSRGECEGDFETKAGRTYSIRLEVKGDVLAAQVITKDRSILLAI